MCCLHAAWGTGRWRLVGWGAEMNYYPFHIGDYLSATRHLSWEEDAAYRRLLDTYYTTEKPLPAELRAVWRLVLATTDSQREAVRIVLDEFFELTPDGWINHRADIEISAMREKQQKQRDRANKRWHKPDAKQTNAPAMPRHEEVHATASEKNANAMPPTPTPTPTPTPITITKKTSAIAPPVGVADSVWSDFCQHRKAKGAKLTQTAMDGIAAEASKAGWSIENALRECCARGWTGFKADWVADKPKARESPSGETAYQRLMRERVAEFSPAIARKAPGAYPLENMILEAENVTAIAGN